MNKPCNRKAECRVIAEFFSEIVYLGHLGCRESHVWISGSDKVDAGLCKNAFAVESYFVERLCHGNGPAGNQMREFVGMLDHPTYSTGLERPLEGVETR